MTTTTRKAPSDVARDVLKVFNALAVDKLSWHSLMAGLRGLNVAAYETWEPPMVQAALAPLGVPTVSLKTDHSKPGAVKGVRRADVEAALAPSPFTPTAEEPLGAHILWVRIIEASAVYQGHLQRSHELDVRIECHAGPGAPCEADDGSCEADDYIGEDQFDAYRGAMPIGVVDGAPVVVWREVDPKPLEGSSGYAWAWRFADPTTGQPGDA